MLIRYIMSFLFFKKWLFKGKRYAFKGCNLELFCLPSERSTPTEKNLLHKEASAFVFE